MSIQLLKLNFCISSLRQVKCESVGECIRKEKIPGSVLSYSKKCVDFLAS